MIKIYRLDGRYVLATQHNSVVCNTVIELIKTMLQVGIDESEVEMGLLEFTRGDNMLEYGVQKKFIYSRRIA